MAMQNATDVSGLNELRQAPHRGHLDLARALAQLRCDERQAKRGVNIRLFGAGHKLPPPEKPIHP